VAVLVPGNSRRRRDPFIGTRAMLSETNVIVRIYIRFLPASARSFSDGVRAFLKATNSASSEFDWPLSGRILAIEEDAERANGQVAGSVEIAVPAEVLGEHGGLSLLLAIATYYSSYASVESYAIQTIDVPRAIMPLLHLAGPQHLITDDLAIGALVKPRFLSEVTGPESYLSWLSSSTFDWVVEDELTTAASVAELRARTKAVTHTLTAGTASNGTTPGYIANLTCRPMDAPKLAEVAIKAGASGVMVNVVTMGFDLLGSLREAIGDAPLFANVIGRGMLCAGNRFYYSEDVICRLARLAGADGVYTGPFVGQIETNLETKERIRRALSFQIVRDMDLQKSTAVMSGGLDFVGVWENAKVYEDALLCLLGSSALTMFAAGINAEAMKAAVDATKENADVDRPTYLGELRDRLGRAKCTDPRLLSLLGVGPED
jgi:ribulose 1,5-bisphosphate carboxylase large subunit-like protein